MSSREESLLVAEQRTLQMIAAGASLAEVLDDLCRTIDAQAPGAISSVLLMDLDGQRLWPGSVSRVPSSFIQAICATDDRPVRRFVRTAAFRQERVIVSDIASDPLWAPFRDLALSHGFRAGWSQPIVSIIERAVILSDSDTFAVDETWLEAKPSETPRSTADLSGDLLKQERKMIEAALAEFSGRISRPAGAAARLGLASRTLDSKIKRLGINKYRFKVRA